ncbi:MAG: ion transporter [Spirochaetota bacterium]
MKYGFQTLLKKIRRKESNIFDNCILATIAFSAVLIGFETDKVLSERFRTFFYYADWIVLWIFIFEIFFKWYAYAPKVHHYFLDSWNLFDFTIVVFSVLPYLVNVDGSTNMDTVSVLRILRLARVFRIFRFISILKPLKMLVLTLLRSLPSMGYVALLILILFYVYGVIGVFQFANTDPEHFANLPLSVLTLFQTITGEGWPDLLFKQLKGPNPIFASMYFISFIVLGSMIILNLLIGIIVSELDNLKETDAKGREYVSFRGHIVVLGWSTKIVYLLNELIEANDGKKGTVITILTNKSKYEMKDFLNHHIDKPVKGIKFVFRTGDAFEKTDLEIVNASKASSIIILNDDGNKNDAYVIKVLIVLMNLFETDEVPVITIPIRNIKNDSIVRLISKDQVYSVLVNDMISRLIAQACRQPGLAVVYDELLSFDGNEIYSKSFQSLQGKTFGEVVNSFQEASVLGVKAADGTVRINPSLSHYVLQEDDEVIAIAASPSTFVLPKKELESLSLSLKPAAQKSEPLPEHIVVIGGNNLLYSIIEELDSYVAIGSSITIYSDSEHFQFQRELLPKNLRAEVNHSALDTDAREQLEEIPFQRFDYVVLLTYSDVLSIEDADSYSIILWLYVRDILESKQLKLPIVVEMLNNKNEVLARPSALDDFVILDKIDSRLLAQFSQNPYLKEIYQELFDESGCEIYLKPALDFVQVDKEYSIHEVSHIVNCIGDLFIGYKTEPDEEDELHKRGIFLNPDKSERVTFAEEDRIIVVARVEYL